VKEQVNGYFQNNITGLIYEEKDQTYKIAGSVNEV